MFVLFCPRLAFWRLLVIVKQIIYTRSCLTWKDHRSCVTKIPLRKRDGSSNMFYPETISIIFIYMFLSTLNRLYTRHQNILKAIILVSSPETVPPPDACQSLGLQRIMEENCTDQMLKTVTVPTKNCLEQTQSRCSVWMLQTTLVTGPKLC